MGKYMRDLPFASFLACDAFLVALLLPHTNGPLCSKNWDYSQLERVPVPVGPPFALQENEKANMAEDLMGDAVDSALDDEGMEQEEEDTCNQVCMHMAVVVELPSYYLARWGMDMMGTLPCKPHCCRTKVWFQH